MWVKEPNCKIKLTLLNFYWTKSLKNTKLNPSPAELILNEHSSLVQGFLLIRPFTD